MELENLYKCLSDLQRLRMLNLLMEGPLCVCHFQDILAESQVKTSKQLQYMKKLGFVEARRESNWMVYSLTQPIPPLLTANLMVLVGNEAQFPAFAEDSQKRKQVLLRYAANPNDCPAIVYQSKSQCC